PPPPPPPPPAASEIDLLMICPKGIIVFESKNYNGWIFANRKHDFWTQSLAVGRGRPSHKERFYSPILQNRGHLWALKAYLGYDGIPMLSVIAFSDDCTLKYISVFDGKKQSEYVTYYSQAASVVQYIFDHEPDWKTDENKINEVYDKLYACTQVNEETKLAHIEDVQEAKAKSLQK
ncbi:MAG: NERD domain-containing protein, partial [Firmicutes bacterium]|nr:NERD domain-containing protein [Bacillota bacterium]